MMSPVSFPGSEEEVMDKKRNRQEAPPKVKAAVASVKQKKSIPKGIPSLSKWRKNSLGKEVTITGRISGSPLYTDGTEVTTSSIAVGEIKSGNVVQTTSGSKYFLS
jgi:hypothetical protein